MHQTSIQKLMKIVLAKYFSFRVNKCTLYTLSQKFITTMEVENDSYINKIWNQDGYFFVYSHVESNW